MAKTPQLGKAKIIQAQTIWSLFGHVIDPTDTHSISPTDPVDKYIHGGAPAVRAFANVLNKSPQFKGFGLALVPGDLANVQDIGDIVAAIIAWLQSHGWKVVI